MAHTPFENLLCSLYRVAVLPEHSDLTDVQLLDRFVRDRDRAALEALVRRHGPLVWGVCRRVLRDERDAKDAFQATFLVLVRKAAALDRRPPLGSWLYEVAQRTALDVRSRAARRQRHERKAADLAPRDVRVEAGGDDLREALDAELSRLPEKYRAPLILWEKRDAFGGKAGRFW